MSRNSSGTYTQPGATTAVSGATIDPTAFNTLISDLGNELTNSLDRGGRGAMTAALNAGGFKVTNAADPTLSTDVATKGYVDGLSGVADGAVTTAKIADAAVTTVKILDANVTFAKLTDVATAAQFQANTASKTLSTDKVWSAAGVVTLTDGATVTLDLSAAINAKVTLGGNRTLAVSNAKVGQGGVLEVIQDGTGSRTLSYTAGSFVFAGGTAITLSTAASSRDLLSYKVLNDGKVLLTAAKAVA